MTEPLLIGMRGWEHPDWEGHFYPAELPADWRFCFYSNRLRSVLLAAEAWPATDADEVRRWRGDCDGQFRFVLELPQTLALPGAVGEFDAHWAGFRALIDPLHASTAGLLLRVPAAAAPDRDWLAHALSVLTSDKPVCVDLPSDAWRTPSVLALLGDTGAGLCWDADAQASPHPGGRFLLGLTAGGNAKVLRRHIEALGAWQHGDSLAGLFIHAPGRPGMAEEARIIAEILGR
jgi:uncharacterized protein YecE (DUF72 family)